MPHTEAGAEFWSAGVSVIIHPSNPNVPAAHMNTRMIVTGNYWFGGGGDLTPMMVTDSPSAMLPRLNSMVASASTEASGFNWLISGQTAPATPTAPTAPAAT